jgi:hypothetical protein
MEPVPDAARAFGFVWSELMVLSAIFNLVVAFYVSVAICAAQVSNSCFVRTAALFVTCYVTMRNIGIRRRRDHRAAAPA